MKTTKTSHFWLGHFDSGQHVSEYFAEVYNEDEASPINRWTSRRSRRASPTQWGAASLREMAVGSADGPPKRQNCQTECGSPFTTNCDSLACGDRKSTRLNSSH